MFIRLLAAALLLTAWAEAEWFPLKVGNQWIYQGAGTRATEPLVLAVTASREFMGATYFRLEGLASGSYWLRSEGERAYQLDEQSGKEVLWYDFSMPEMKPYATQVPGGMGTGVILQKNASVKMPAGLFEHGIEITYPTVFQVGITREVYIDGIGLVFRSQNTGGPSVGSYQLMYARTGEATFVSVPGCGAQLSVNARGTAARFSVSNAQASEAAFRLFDDTGSVIWTTSAALSSGQAVAVLPVLKPGDYALEASSGEWRATVPFTTR